MHFTNKEYEFISIALPIKDDMIDNLHLQKFINASYRQREKQLDVFTCSDGALFIDSDVPHVIYQSKNDYGTDKVLATEVNHFFGYVRFSGGSVITRFSLKE